MNDMIFVCVILLFFSDMEETGQNKKVVCTGKSTEMVTNGGESKFVCQIVDDSFQLKDKIRWYTSMVGKKVTLSHVKKALKNLGILNVRTTEFFQGKTTIWAIAWSFSNEGLDDILATKIPLRKNFKLKIHSWEFIDSPAKKNRKFEENSDEIWDCL